jgi:uncharacterized membrane protein YfcA
MTEEVIAYGLALFVGIILGLVGAGGSILTLPILVKVAGIEPKFATTYSLFIVGITAMIGALNYYRQGLLHLKTAAVFTVPSLFTVFVMRRFIMPEVPDELIELDSIILTKNFLIFLIFGIVMLVASLSMIRGASKNVENQDIKNMTFNYKAIFYQGFMVGILTGLVGAGGGFLIVPSLVRFAKLPIRLTIGTSLLIITVNSLSGFAIDVANVDFTIDWTFLLIFSGIAAGGIFLGMYISQFIKAPLLKKMFGYFVLVMAIYILWRELFGVLIL